MKHVVLFSTVIVSIATTWFMLEAQPVYGDLGRYIAWKYWRWIIGFVCLLWLNLVCCGYALVRLARLHTTGGKLTHLEGSARSGSLIAPGLAESISNE